jgi:hypothetical protein
MGNNDGLPRTARVGVPSMSALQGGGTICSARFPVHRFDERRLTRAWAYEHNHPAEFVSDDNNCADEHQTHPGYS